MAIDPFALTIGSVMTGLGYQTILCTEPKLRDYDPPLPTVFVSPIKDRSYTWIAFNTVSTRSIYELVYVLPPNELDTTLTSNYVWTFKLNVQQQFMGVSTAMALTVPKPWNCAVEDVRTYNRALLRKGYTYSGVRVLVDWISK